MKHGALALDNYRKEYGSWNKGKTPSQETINKIKETMRNKPLLTCEVCGFTSNSKGNMRQRCSS